MSRRRRRPKGPPRCKDCGRPVAWFRWAHTGHWRTFEPAPVRVAGQHAAAYPVEGGARAWLHRDLVEDLMVRRRCSESDAEAEARDMPWHALHFCPTTPEPDPEGAPTP